MKNRLKKILSFSLIITACMPVAFTMFFLFKQQVIRHEMKERLEDEFSHTITVPADKVGWVKYKKEIRYEGRLFDIKSMTLSGQQYIFTGLFDEEETALVDFYNCNTDQQNKKQKDVLIRLFQILQTAYTINYDDLLAKAKEKQAYSGLILSTIPSPIISILTPPPQL